MLEHKPDYEECKKRIDAWWHCEVIDRALTFITVQRPDSPPPPPSHHENLIDRWLDIEYMVERAQHHCQTTMHLGDAIPKFHPNLGPSIFSALYGCPLIFGQRSSWTKPILDSWDDADSVRFNPDSPYFKKYHEMTDALLDAGKGKWVTSLWDIHTGGDHLACLRGAENLCMDLLSEPDAIKRFLDRMHDDWMQIYDSYWQKIHAAGLPTGCYHPMIANGRFYVVNDDFTCMISTEMYEEFFRPLIQRQCQFLDHSLYHLDGPDALRHLDSILEIPELDAVQFQMGAGNYGYRKWIDVYRRIQASGKGLEVICDANELPLVMETLRPEGVFLRVGRVKSTDHADSVLKDIAKWT